MLNNKALKRSSVLSVAKTAYSTYLITGRSYGTIGKYSWTLVYAEQFSMDNAIRVKDNMTGQTELFKVMKSWGA